jgi:hypothetical protein
MEKELPEPSYRKRWKDSQWKGLISWLWNLLHCTFLDYMKISTISRITLQNRRHNSYNELNSGHCVYCNQKRCSISPHTHTHFYWIGLDNLRNSNLSNLLQIPYQIQHFACLHKNIINIHRTEIVYCNNRLITCYSFV